MLKLAFQLRSPHLSPTSLKENKRAINKIEKIDCIARYENVKFEMLERCEESLSEQIKSSRKIVQEEI